MRSAVTIPAIPAIPYDELAPALAEALGPRVQRLGYLGEFFQRTAHQPETLRAFDQFTQAARASLPAPLAETVSLTVATALGNDYERHQHERLAIRVGLDRTWVEAVERLDPEHTPELQPEQLATQRYVLAALTQAGRGAAAALEALVDEVGVETAVGVLFVTGRYVAHAIVVNSLELAPPVPSIFEDGFDGT